MRFAAGVTMDGISETLKGFFASVIPENVENVEIEAKFGRFIDKNTNQRLKLPILTETILEPGNWYRFDSVLSVSEHATFNKWLNGKVGPDRRWSYKHTKTVDTVLSKGQQGKVRVTRNEAKTEVIEMMRKERIGDIAIFMPNSPFDIRISANLEIPVQITQADVQQLASGIYDSERFKDRRSYLDKENGFQYDLTMVEQTARGCTETKYELELEIADNFTETFANPSKLVKELRNLSKIFKS